MSTAEAQEELLLCCRHGELEEVQDYTAKFGAASLDHVRDENGNTVLHMVCGNGHEDILDYLLPTISSSLLSISNQAGSTPLHWASLNSHLNIMKKLVLFPGGPGAALIDIKNAAGRTPLGEAEFAGWEEGSRWLIEQMRLDEQASWDREEDATPEDLKPETGDVDVERQDGEGGVSGLDLEERQRTSIPK